MRSAFAHWPSEPRPRTGPHRNRLALLFGQAEGEDEAAFVPEVHAGFIAVIDGLARDHPVLVIFEDAHTLKPPMLDLIGDSARVARLRGALILALARGELLEQRPTL